MVPVLLACLATGSLLDWQVSSLLYDSHNLFGRIGQAYGQWPAEVTAAAAGIMLARSYEHEPARSGFQTALMILGLCLLPAAIICDVWRASLVFGQVPLLRRIAISAALICVPNIFILIATAKVQPQLLRRYAGACMFVIAAQLIIVNLVLKPLWQRPRMRIIVAHEKLSFQPWWQIGCKQAAKFIAKGVSADGFKSFPSGHSANAACGLLLALLPAILPRAKKLQPVLFWGSVTCAFAVMVSRIVAGAHFVSDVTMGFGITFVLVLVAAGYLKTNEFIDNKLAAANLAPEPAQPSAAHDAAVAEGLARLNEAPAAQSAPAAGEGATPASSDDAEA